MLRHVRLVLFGAAMMLAPSTVRAADHAHVVVRLGAHDRFGRVVVSVPAGTDCVLSRQDDDEVLHFSQTVHIDGLGKGHAPGVVLLRSAPDQLAIRLRPGSVVRTMRFGGHLVLDVFAPVRVQPSGMPAHAGNGGAHPASMAPAGSVLPGLPSPLMAVVDGAFEKPPQATGLVAPSAPVADGGAPDAAVAHEAAAAGSIAHPDGGPVSISASILPETPQGEGGLMLPFDPGVGAAAFRLGNRLFVVFDRAKPVDLASIAADPVFGGASFSLLASGAVLVMPVAPDRQALVSRRPGGWLVMLGGSHGPAADILPHAVSGGVELPVTAAGRVIVVHDPGRGTDLLVGTTRQDGQMMNVARRGTSYVLARTLLGVVVERLSDQLELRPVAAGFLLADSRGIGALGQDTDEPAAFSRCLDLADVPLQDLWHRYKAALARAAAAPVAARRLPRLDAAEAALAMGMAREAGVLASVADQDAPGGSDQPRALFIEAAASLLAGDSDATTRLADARIGNSDEAELWRALDLARREPGSVEAARAIAGRLKLLRSYPSLLRRQLLGDAALDIVAAGDKASAALVDDLGPDPKVMLAQAIREGAEVAAFKREKPTAAQVARIHAILGRFDRLAADPDPMIATRAAEAAVSIRLDRHLLDPGQAADRLEAQFLEARMAGLELPLRLRVAELRARQRDWPAALSELRDLMGSFPADAAQVRLAAATVLQEMAAPVPAGSGGHPVDPVTQLTLLEGNQDLLPGGAAGVNAAIDLARRLARLDLPDRAASFLRKAMVQTGPDATGGGAATTGADRARLGLELAQLQLDQNDGAAAQSELDATETAGLPPDVVTARSLLRAKALASTGDADGALRALATLTGADADDLRIRELAARHDWAGEASALSVLAGATLPVSGMLDRSGEELVLRLAGAMAQSGEQDALHRLGPTWAARFPDPAQRDMLRLLTAPGVTAVTDLQRSADDLKATHSALAGLEPVRHGRGS